ncbi:PorT family protein [Polaribacter vadi]|uniref:type IX secretion/gliding motility protein PorT/SprT n=1 Tax=Polaribacter TaxID=52959 RepID=UPI001C0935A5|nr:MULTISPECIES: porin family protein [Polaribacter]MBU3010811.1 PorT family protein [Polaribacter vadi]MDO6740622.1 porin family protein [Polaribacter sp. 1_MG-2023]
MIKKIILFGFFLMISATFFAQRERVENLPTFDKRKIHYGFYLGLNQNDFKLNLRNSEVFDADITVEPTYGFNVGLIAELRLHKNLSIRLEPGLVSNSKNIIFNHLNSTGNPQDSIREIGSTYLHFPVVFKFSTDRYKNIRPYLLAGVSYDHNFSSNEANQDDNSSGQFRMTTSNFMYEAGIGIDIYLSFFKFSPSIRGVFAINNEIKYDDDPNSNWTAPVNFMGTRGVFLNFAFE